VVEPRAEALAQAVQVIERHGGGGESIGDSNEFRREEPRIEPDEVDLGQSGPTR
jgi:hypothetical protein